MAVKGKFNVLRELINIKFVLGNGFDLHLGLKTRYKDFFEADEGMKVVNEWFEKLVFNQNHFPFACINENELEIILNKNANTIWDLYFYIKSEKLKNWCDVEEEIYKSLIKNPVDSFWDKVFNKQKNYDFVNLRINNFYSHEIFPIYLKTRGVANIPTREKFYFFLLEELNTFERKFCKYIASQINEIEYTLNTKDCLQKWLGTPFDSRRDISIDTFNYTTPRINSVQTYNINGTLDNAIFGIDNPPINEEDITCIFRKTYRRFKNDMRTQLVSEETKFDNIVIFGHSLNEQDYGYFFPVFDRMKISSSLFEGKIIFAYTTYYDKENEDLIEHNYRMKVMKLLASYEEYVFGKKNNRLLDNLNYKKNVIFLNVDRYC